MVQVDWEKSTYYTKSEKQNPILVVSVKEHHVASYNLHVCSVFHSCQNHF